jgi:uncharacterized protein (DUF58 family)
MLSALEHGIRKRANKWLFRFTHAEPGEVFLHQRRVYILPTHPGLLFCATLVALFIGSVNYNLSLGFGFTFMIAACALIDMHLTYRNLAHLYLKPGRARPVFAGEEAQFELQLTNRRKHYRYAIWLDFISDGGVSSLPHAAEFAPHATQTVALSAPARKRGWLPAPRVRLQTRFPLGLLRAWSYWHPDVKALVYPQPEEDAGALPFGGHENTDGRGHGGHDDFAGVRGYQAGDSLKRLAWRQIAKVDVEHGGSLVTKYFEGGEATEVSLDFDQLPRQMDIEAKLSRMTRWVIEAEARGVPYGFHLGDTKLAPASGPAHQEACLRALALYQEGP